MSRVEEFHEQILQHMDLSKDVDDEELTEIIHRVLDRKDVGYISLKEKALIGRELFNAFRKLDILQELIEDDEVTEIMINGTKNIFIEKEGKIFELDMRFMSREKLEDVIQQIVAGANRIVNEASPIVDARLEDGSRVHVILPPVSVDGPTVTIRKFPKEKITMKQLISWNSIGSDVAELLQKLMKARYNIFISGGTGSGKTTFLNALSDFIPEDERVITIEDNAELQIREVPNLVRLEVRNANVEGVGEITMRDLIKASLRMRPTRIIVGEVRGKEAVDMLQSLNTGHSGASSGHANSPRDMISRLETMVLMGMDIPLSAIRRQIASAIDIIVHLGRLRDKTRKVLQIAEVIGYGEGEVQLQTLYEFREKEMIEEKIIGEWVKVSEMQRKEKLLAAGYS